MNFHENLMNIEHIEGIKNICLFDPNDIRISYYALSIRLIGVS